ncbi:glycoside hydrolase family 27 protein [Periconia macrospinosa]|uniref:Alpha-galactosidase n=1 Tax=Periconia macrospinosa TaxID=97972 RepID=A0A2V1D2W8_9PLEO|nr:glycoside hydrolase family 27 protein [Periconia macrospinosa]
MAQYSILLRTVVVFMVTLATVFSRGNLVHAAPVLSPDLRPPMGWSSWSSLRGKINATSIKAQSLAMNKSLQKYGYEYINMDAGWYSGVDDYGRTTWDSKKFPDGIAPVAQYVHSLGQKFGIYLVPGIPAAAVAANSPIKGTRYRISDIVAPNLPGNTANDSSAAIDYTKPGAAAYVQSQADLFASWGVDYIKMDFVGPGGGRIAADNRADIEHWHQAILNTNRFMYLGLSNSLSFANAATWQRYSNGWRIDGDIECYSHCTGLTNFTVRVALRFADVPKWVPFAGPGHWNDLDSIEVGNGAADGLTPDERQTMLTLWSIESAPLLLGIDLTKLDPLGLELITNSEVIAVDQSGHPALPLSQATKQQVWFSNNQDGSYTVALFNLADITATVAVSWKDLGITGPVTARNLWTHTDLGRQPANYSASLGPHASQLLRIVEL